MAEDRPGNGTFRCHPKCLEWSYIRRCLIGLAEDISGLRPGQFADLVVEVERAELQAEADRSTLTRFDDPDTAVASWWDRPATDIGRAAAVELYVRGWDGDQVDTAFGFPHGATQRVIDRTRVHPKARDIVAAHLDGYSPSRISRDMGVGIPTVCEILRRIGEQPHVIHDRARSADINRAVQKRYEEGWGYRQIADHLNLTESQVRNRLQYLRRKGRITQPPRGMAHQRGRLRAAE
jgi:transposase